MPKQTENPYRQAIEVLSQRLLTHDKRAKLYDYLLQALGDSQQAEDIVEGRVYYKVGKEYVYGFNPAHPIAGLNIARVNQALKEIANLEYAVHRAESQRLQTALEASRHGKRT